MPHSKYVRKFSLGIMSKLVEQEAVELAIARV